MGRYRCGSGWALVVCLLEIYIMAKLSSHSYSDRLVKNGMYKRFINSSFLLILKSTELKPSRTNVDAAEIRNFKLFSCVVWKIR